LSGLKPIILRINEVTPINKSPNIRGIVAKEKERERLTMAQATRIVSHL
jgi:hypothetical protein